MFRQKKHSLFWLIGALAHRILVLTGAVVLTLVFFLLLPFIQTLSEPPNTDTVVREVTIAQLEAPEPPPEPEPEEKPEPKEEPPELNEETPPLGLEQLELALNPNFNAGLLQGDFTVNLKTIGKQSQTIDELFSLADLDQKPRVVYQPSPTMTERMRERAPATVYIIFIVDQQGRVVNPQVQRATDPVFEKAALSALKQWKFEPGKRNGEPVRFRMRVPITFPKG